MKIVDRKTFLALPDGTVFRRFLEGTIQETLEVKGNTTREMTDDFAGDFNTMEVGGRIEMEDPSKSEHVAAEKAAETGASLPIMFDGWGRDGGYDEEEWYAVYEVQEMAAMIAMLTKCYDQVMFGK
jgi:hypothetical protein